MKNLGLILLAVIGTSLATYAQTEPSTKPKLDKTPQQMPAKKATKKKVAASKKETPAPAPSKKAN